MSRKVLYAVVAVAIIVLGLIAVFVWPKPWGIRTSGPCTQMSVRLYSVKAWVIIDRYDDARQLAETSPRSTVPVPLALAHLQDARRDYAMLTPPDCLSDAHRAMLASIDHSAAAFQAFNAGKSDETVSDLRMRASEEFATALEAILTVAEAAQ